MKPAEVVNSERVTLFRLHPRFARPSVDPSLPDDESCDSSGGNRQEGGRRKAPAPRAWEFGSKVEPVKRDSPRKGLGGFGKLRVGQEAGDHALHMRSVGLAESLMSGGPGAFRKCTPKKLPEGLLKTPAQRG